METSRVWLITGCSTGFGKLLSERLLKQGERVVATARKLESLSSLSSLVKTENQLIRMRLDVTQNHLIQTVIQHTLEKFGKIDILVNNAGYGYVGALEETSESEIRKIFNTNVFGLIKMIRAVLPQMRQQKSGHIINLSSVSGVVALPGVSIYAATKFAVEAISESLSAEVSSFGIKITIIEPSGFRTDFAGRSIHKTPPMKEYDESLNYTRNYYQTINGNQPGDPNKAVDAIIQMANHPQPPLRLVLGVNALQRVQKKLEQYVTEMSEWKEVTLDADFKTSKKHHFETQIL